jgi:hypothetical protein
VHDGLSNAKPEIYRTPSVLVNVSESLIGDLSSPDPDGPHLLTDTQ